jgi:DNA-directed RNA polymerase specialized sigma24 family protein
MEYASDVRRYAEFLARWKGAPGLESDSVVLTVRSKAPKAAALGWADWVKDLEQETLLKLAQGKYRGEGPLDGYIAHVLANEIRLIWRREGRNRRAEMPEELDDHSDFTSDIEWSERVKLLRAKSPKHLWWFIEAVIDYEGYLSERDAATNGRVTRHRIARLKEELRQIWEGMEETNRAKANAAGD